MAPQEEPTSWYLGVGFLASRTVRHWMSGFTIAPYPHHCAPSVWYFVMGALPSKLIQPVMLTLVLPRCSNNLPGTYNPENKWKRALERPYHCQTSRCLYKSWHDDSYYQAQRCTQSAADRALYVTCAAEFFKMIRISSLFPFSYQSILKGMIVSLKDSNS